ncbi:MAG: chemotaxis protein CheW [Planctomycetes bacterium]|nr:chemotaxis protein CheW [Planctomycetota bacterium]
MTDPAQRLALQEFLAESREGLALVEAELLALERDPTARPRVDAAFRALHTLKGTAGFLGLAALEALAHEGEELLAAARAGALELAGEPVGTLLGLVDRLRAGLDALEPAAQAAPGAEAGREAGEASVRVDVAAMDRLMDLTGELVLVRNQLLQLAAGAVAGPLVAASQRLDQVTSDLQGEVMRTRLQPIGTLWGPLRRVARDLAAALAKRARVDVEGGETELDRALIEAVRGPLGHLVRNAIDHGLEPPAARRAAGKPEEGRIALRARHEGGKVVIEVHDDGAGLDPRALADRAVTAGQLTREEAGRLPERELLALALRPGLSTAGAVTALSGRGVGLDAVKTSVERVGGAVELMSAPGRGTTVRLVIPLTLAIIPALLVASGGQRFALPQAHVLEVVRVDAGVERVLGAPVFRLRGRLLSLVHLDAELRPDDPAAAAAAPGDDAAVVVLEADGRRLGLLVAEVHDTEEIVVKPLGALLAGHPLFAGATVLGDGGVALILDVAGLVARASERRGDDATAAAAPSGPAAGAALLVVEAGAERAALPLEAVARLEELPRAALERALGRDVVQHRGEVVPLVALGRALGAPAAGPPPDPVPLVMVAGPMGAVGLAVDRVLDVFEGAAAPAAPATRRRGVAGTAVIAGRVTQVLDVPELVAAALEGGA